MLLSFVLYSSSGVGAGLDCYPLLGCLHHYHIFEQLLSNPMSGGVSLLSHSKSGVGIVGAISSRSFAAQIEKPLPSLSSTQSKIQKSSENEEAFEALLKFSSPSSSSLSSFLIV